MTRPELAEALRRLGVREGAVLMVHTRISAIGCVDGAEDGVVGALLDALGPTGSRATIPRRTATERTARSRACVTRTGRC